MNIQFAMKSVAPDGIQTHASCILDEHPNH